MSNAAGLPPYISTGDPGSFAWKTIRQRKPAILRQVAEKNRLPGTIQQRLASLLEEIEQGSIRNPFEEYALAPESSPGALGDRELRIWRREIARYAGSPWGAVPWYFAEAYFYLRLLLAFGYYEPHLPTFRQDPFQPLKEEELHGPGGGVEMAARILKLLLEKTTPEADLKTLLQTSLWANRMDLSNFQIVDRYRAQALGQHSQYLLRDDSEALAERLLGAQRIDIILDNAGQELVCDLLFLSFLFGRSEQLQVTLHVKKAPLFVSDTLAADVHTTIQGLARTAHPQGARVSEQLRALVDRGSLRIKEHFFWNGPLHFPKLSGELREELAASELVLLKGDANYRRLLADRHWDPSTRMEEITAYFPAPFAVLRTMKSEIVVDLSREAVEQLNQADPDWMINGRRGIIRLVG